MFSLAGCRQLLGIDEGSVEDAAVIDAPPADMPIDACADDDDDGVCNTLDTWPCGTEPMDLPSTVTYEEMVNNSTIRAQLTNTTINDARKLVVAPGADLKVKTQYSIFDCVCLSCIDQIEIGFAPTVGRQGCAYNGNPTSTTILDCMVPTTGAKSVDLVAPTAPGAYTLRFKIGQDDNCGTQTAWWNNTEPPATASAVHLCVAP